LTGCAECRAYLEGLQATGAALAQLAVAPINPAQQAVALQAFREFARKRAALPLPVAPPHRAGLSMPLALSLTAVGTALQVALARHPSPIGWPWAPAAVVFLAACALLLLARRRGLLATALGTAVAIGLALLAGRGELALFVGVQCAVHELGTALIPVATLLLLQRSADPARSAIVGAAAAGALAGTAALHLTCPDAGSMLHVLVFHVGGVLAAAGLAGAAAARLLRPARVTG
jgi:hypothetical protein